jgi:hypothetical protein
VSKERERQRNLLLMGCPALWACWPMLPLVRRCRGKEELGLLFDALRVNGTTGFSATVFEGNLFLLPPTVEEFLKLPRETYDTPDEVFAAGWRVD